MNNNKKTNEEIFQSWGEDKRQLPINNALLKSSILAQTEILARSNANKFVKSKNIFRFVPATFVAIAVFVFLVNMNSYKSESNIQTMGVADMMTSSPSESTFYRENNLSIKDNREFLKIGYNATLETRNTSDLAKKIEITVRGFDGRIDSVNNSDKGGYISFAIPKDKLEAFRLEIKDLVGERFYSEYINSQNLLSEKQGIENWQKQIEDRLEVLNSERGQLVKNHNKNISYYQGKIDAINTEIILLNLEYKSANLQRQIEITNRINQLQPDVSSFNAEILNENRNYNQRIYEKDNEIKTNRENLKSAQKQDSDLLERVETVNGSISLKWISLWRVVDVYLPGPLLAWIFLGLGLVSYLWYRYYIRVINARF
ncbi:MAG: hypothetical protein AAB873_02205 [Patescibacteria group bacterium]